MTDRIDISYRPGTIHDLTQLRELAIKSWARFQALLTNENWERLNKTLNDEHTFVELLDKSESIVCTTEEGRVIGMAFLTSSGNPTEIYHKDWCYIRFVTVDPDFAGRGIGTKLTTKCIDLARKNGETIVALHTSELMANAMRIYEALGFRILREIDPRLGKRYWLYQLELT